MMFKAQLSSAEIAQRVGSGALGLTLALLVLGGCEPGPPGWAGESERDTSAKQTGTGASQVDEGLTPALSGGRDERHLEFSGWTCPDPPVRPWRVKVVDFHRTATGSMAMFQFQDEHRNPTCPTFAGADILWKSNAWSPPREGWLDWSEALYFGDGRWRIDLPAWPENACGRVWLNVFVQVNGDRLYGDHYWRDEPCP